MSSTGNNPSREQWHRLFNAALNGTMTNAEHDQLSEVLRESPEARQLWFIYTDNEIGLCELDPLAGPPDLFDKVLAQASDFEQGDSQAICEPGVRGKERHAAWAKYHSMFNGILAGVAMVMLLQAAWSYVLLIRLQGAAASVAEIVRLTMS